MKLLDIAAAASLALYAQTGIAQPPPAPPSEALIDRFMASLPPDPLAGRAEPDPDALKALAALNPGKEGQLAEILGEFDRCLSAAVAAGTTRMVRTMARDLGAEKVERLTDFYNGPDVAAFAAAQERIKAGTPARTDAAELERMAAAYPLADLRDAMKRAEQRVPSDSLFNSAVGQCAQTRNAALARATIKLR